MFTQLLRLRGLMALAAVLLLPALALAQVPGLPAGSNPTAQGTITEIVGSGEHWDVGSANVPAEIYYDPNAGPWVKRLLQVNPFPFPPNTWTMTEWIHVNRGLAFTDWHEDMLDPGWAWTQGSLTDPAGKVFVGQISPDGKGIDFFFDPLPPCSIFRIDKTFTWNLAGAGPAQFVTIAEYPTVPEPAGLMLVALSSAAMLIRRR